MSMVSACVVRCSAARAGRPGDTDQREAGVRAALPLIPCTCVCACVWRPGPLTQPKGPQIHTDTHPCHSKTHNTFIKLQNRKKSSSQNFVNFLHQNSNKISIHHTYPAHRLPTFPITSPYHKDTLQQNLHAFPTLIQQEKCFPFPFFPLLLYISRNSATELLSLGFSKCRCFLSSPSRCPCHAIMRNSAQMVSRKCNGHECCFKESFEKYLAASYYWDLLKMCCVLER